MIITLLGTGTSHGVPVLGCDCATCRSQDPRDRRTRSSVYLESDQTCILIDTATELRIQALRHQIPRVDAVLLTHHHADHVCGFDDLRRFNELQGTEIPVYGNAAALQGIRAMFPYIFDDQAQLGGGKPRVRLLQATRPFTAGKLRVIPIPVWHGRIPVLGFRIADFAYVTDCSAIPSAGMAQLTGLKLLVLGVLRFRPHPTHLNLEDALRLVDVLKPRRCLLTHICHDFKHDLVTRILPAGIELGYDGQRIEL